MSAIAAAEPSSPFERGEANTTESTHAAERGDNSARSHLEGAFWDNRRSANARQRQTSLFLAVPLVALFGILDGYIAPDAKGALWLIRFGVFVPAILTVLTITLVTPLQEWSEVAAMLGVFVAGSCVVAMALIAPFHHAGILLVVFASYTFLGLRFAFASSASLAVTMFYLVVAVADGSTPWPALATNMFFLLGCNVIGAFVCYVLEQSARQQFFYNHALGEQSDLSEHLLRDVFPVSVEQRLKSGSGSIADAHPDVSILFADIVDFTPYAAAVAPERLVRVLDEVFTGFDHLAEVHDLEKIKTIGDAYMVAGGMRTRDRDHVRAVAEMALDMLDSLTAIDLGNGQRATLRVGIHTGPVVAGVIGRSKFSYDVWGDTVNVASRLVGLTMPGTILVSESTYERLRGDYAFSPRQIVSVKGRGAIPCYVLQARKETTGNRLGSGNCRTTLRPIGDALASVRVLPCRPA